LQKEADAVETAVSQVLADGYRTSDIAYHSQQPVSTEKMGDLVAEALR
jgi:3-isopropylmalate dehydrogenase